MLTVPSAGAEATVNVTGPVASTVGVMSTGAPLGVPAVVVPEAPDATGTTSTLTVTGADVVPPEPVTV